MRSHRLQQRAHKNIRFSVFEELEKRQLFSVAVESIDGSGNNLLHPTWGSTNTDLLRIVAPAYADGVSAPAGTTRPSARVVSNTIDAQGNVDLPNNRDMSAFIWAWGQFIDHDLDLTNDGSEAMNISVPTGDPYFDPNSTGDQVIYFNRSQYDPSTGTSAANPRQQENFITAWIDGSMIYGSDPTRAAALRTFSGGLMKTSAGDLLPFNTAGFDNATGGGDPTSYFLAGDVRANENVGLTAMQTLFVREHNRLATQISKTNPTWTDEQIFQEARKIVIAELQSITYNEFLPALLGHPLAPYRGYNPNVNPSITNEFSTAAYRFGHSTLEDDIEFMGNDGQCVDPTVSLAQAFFNPALLEQTGIDPLMKYLATTNTQEIDPKIVDSLRNFLFGPPGAGGFDLASLNIQRGRDHGLADYNTTRAALGLPKVTTFAQITSDPTTQSELQSLYGSVDNIDLWVGGLAEDHLPGSSLGPTFGRIIADQFTRLRDGDRFWYQINLNPQEMSLVQHSSLAEIIARNTTTTNLQPNVFFYDISIAGRVYSDWNHNGRADFGDVGLAGWTIQLLNSAGNVVETTSSNKDGSYLFDHLDPGGYTVKIVSQSNWTTTTKTPPMFTLTKAIAMNRVDFGEYTPSLQPPAWQPPYNIWSNQPIPGTSGPQRGGPGDVLHSMTRSVLS